VTYEQLLNKAVRLAKKEAKEIEAAKVLLVELSGLSSSEFYLSYKMEVSEDFIAKYETLLKRYLYDHEPIQHLLGYSYFYGYRLKVNEDVLIPRAETEQLVEWVLSLYDTYFNNQEVDVLDLGTGSGCIAIALALEEQKMKVDAIDVTKEALEVAKSNANTLRASISFKVSSWFDNVTKKYDIIVANPPYIPDIEVVDSIVKKEPSQALYGGADGLDPYRQILSQAEKHLKPKALIAFEHGFQHKDKMFELAKKYFPNAFIFQEKDLANKDRFTFVYIGEKDEGQNTSNIAN